MSAHPPSHSAVEDAVKSSPYAKKAAWELMAVEPNSLPPTLSMLQCMGTLDTLLGFAEWLSLRILPGLEPPHRRTRLQQQVGSFEKDLREMKQLHERHRGLPTMKVEELENFYQKLVRPTLMTIVGIEEPIFAQFDKIRRRLESVPSAQGLELKAAATVLHAFYQAGWDNLSPWQKLCELDLAYPRVKKTPTAHSLGHQAHLVPQARQGSRASAVWKGESSRWQ
ncbi:hypothetical protein BCR35DRAFT_332697 [Leucosporidium creatinivorum]|uniref:Uncharacterized protein n=1 Tax=Leucosporidium creatinivorum TaxID=106004 RepID=A0A1Y2F1P5_9BASI|nr:hypothetical protein BCR35DRAFT_332697 [Leucosporidium creatinivorum]